MAARSAGPLRRLAEPPTKTALRCLALTRSTILVALARKASVSRTARSTWRAVCTSHALAPPLRSALTLRPSHRAFCSLSASKVLNSS